jgi:hypothetical protein
MKTYNLIGLAKQIQSASPQFLNDRVEAIEKDMSMYAVTGDFPDVMTFVELTMISQKCMELAKDELTQEEQNRENVIPIGWTTVPRGDDKKYWLNEFGSRRWESISKYFNVPATTVERAYCWVDRAIMLNPDRTVINEMTFTEFIETEARNYIPVLPEEKK